MNKFAFTVAILALSLAALCVAGCEVSNTNPGSNPDAFQSDAKTQVAQAPAVAPIAYDKALGSIVQRDDKMYLDGKFVGDIGTVRCMPDGGCMSVVDTNSHFGTKSGALVDLDGGIPMNSDCQGNCGPIGLDWCGDATLKGQPYTNRWHCAPQIVNGVCHMMASPMPCGTGETCELTGKYPSYAQCLKCTANADCNDNNVCTTDACNLLTGQCTFTSNNASCDDGNKCNGVEMCQGGQCKPGTAPVCDDANICTTDSCVPATGCLYVPNNLACNDLNACTLNDTCLNGACNPGSNPDCNDNNVCTTDACVPTVGCTHNNVPDTTGCNDGSACTTQDSCTAGKCAGKPTSCDDNNPCTVDTCTAATGACVHTNAVDNTPCGEAKMCVNGACSAANETCTTKDMVWCLQSAGVLGSYKCIFAAGANAGIWSVLEICGAVGTGICLDGAGCANIDAKEASCSDGLDNDGDGKIDCADTDCALDNACKKCSAANPCPAGQLCSAAGICQQAPACTPQCNGKQCGPDGCGQTCGVCANSMACNAAFQCVQNPPANTFTIACPSGLTLRFWGDVGQVLSTTVCTGAAMAGPAGTKSATVDNYQPAAGACTCTFDPNGNTCHSLSGGGFGCQT